MSTPTGDNAFLHVLELNVRTELTQAKTSQAEEGAVRVPIDEWLSDPADAQGYEVGLRTLLGAVEALEDGSGPATILLRARCLRAQNSGHLPNWPDGAPRRKAGERCSLNRHFPGRRKVRRERVLTARVRTQTGYGHRHRRGPTP